MKHFSHSHALKLSEKEKNYEEILCSGCEQQLSGAAYCCTKRDCDFILHKSCFELPKKLQHKSHHNHDFTLLAEPPSYSLYYCCDACGDLIQAFSFHCEECDYKLHVKCAFLPESVECKAHKHYLDLWYTTSKGNEDGCSFFLCDVCGGGVTEGYWSYYCKECDFGTHLECATCAEFAEEEKEDGEKEEVAKEEEEGEEGEESDAVKLAKASIRAMDQMAKLQFQMQMAHLNAKTKAMLFRTPY